MDPSHSQRWNAIVEEGLKDRQGCYLHPPSLAPPPSNHLNVPPPSGQTPVQRIEERKRSPHKTTTAPGPVPAKNSRKLTESSENGPEPKKTKRVSTKDRGRTMVNSDDEFSGFLD